MLLVWLWGVVLTAYVCYGRHQFQATHLSSALTGSSVQNQSNYSAGIGNKFAD
jgi:hypothetical protein